MRINGPSRAVGPQAGGATRRAAMAGGSFAPATAEPEARPMGGAHAPVLAGLDALIALQSVEDDLPRQRRRRTVRKGNELLDVLEEIKLAFLGGGLSGTALDRAAALLVSLEPSGDPGLDSLIEDIALRAEVELAKQGRFLNRS
ncbi:flagellar assembly protein FliX [Chthonobacter rhizosphaerae]|uniref:flagellar assembly protein FliX n=1 Tax=Chthonobacter rhizosphaerae TaxID=2735553 RepID=UPI0015EFB610|nr:flagellar assembly protein FliX [Chthonobacter rhizosphaerae]